MNTEVNERGQAAVEAALILPMVLFVFFGILQMALLHQARIITEYAAYRTARSGAVYRADCQHMRRAALLGLAPLLWEVGGDSDPEARLAETANRVVKGGGNVLPRRDSRPPSNVPAVLVTYRVDPITCPDGRKGDYDYALQERCSPMRVRVRLNHFVQASIPFAGDIIARVWLASKTGEAWATGNDPTMLAARPNEIHGNMGSTDPQVVNWARIALGQNRPVIPVQATWSLRMHSDPRVNFGVPYQCL